MAIYLIEHATQKFTGYFGGVDFHQGRGSTSSHADAKRLARLGYRVSELGVLQSKTEGVPAGTPSAIPSVPPAPLGPGAATEPPVFANREDRRVHEVLVKRMGGKETKPAVHKGGKKK